MSNFTELNLEKPLYEYCCNATNKEGDTFVGVKSEIINGVHTMKIYFPIGYEISMNDEDVRDEIISLFRVLQEYNDEKSIVSSISKDQLLKTVRFPVEAFLRIIFDYYNNGPYKIEEDQFSTGQSGKISWNHTRKKIQPIPTQNGFVYPTYIVQQYSETDKKLITEISNVCVYESYLKIGWIYRFPPIQKPQRTRELSVYKSYMNEMLLKATKDKDIILFQAMLDVLNFTNSDNDTNEFYFGTNRFEYIWEKMIQDMYGNVSKEIYLPRTHWFLNIGKTRKNDTINPDTIMKYDKDVFVLDAKYYKFGETTLPKDLPESTSINKQISYGEYIFTNEKFKEERENGMGIYNAFLLPFNTNSGKFISQGSKYYAIGEAVAEWKDSIESHERVQGILIDVKHLMNNTIKPNMKEIELLSSEIINSLKANKRD